MHNDYEHRSDAPPLDVLVVAAFPPELVAIRAALKGAVWGDVGGLVVGVGTVGVGLAKAGVGAAAALMSHRGVRGVVLIGTCGAYSGRGLSIGDVVVARGVLLVDAAEEGKTAVPEAVATRIACHGALAGALVSPGLTHADVATTLGVTIDDALAARLTRSTGCAAEHLEAFAVATACAARDIPFAAVLGVANMVGSRARAEWKANHVAAGAAAAARVLSWVQGGAPGLPPREVG